MKCYAFDCDDTLKIGPRPGPIDVADLKTLMDQGNIVGMCGNYLVMMKYWPQWYTVISFFGGHPPLVPYKPQFLQLVKESILLGNRAVQDFVMVGNTVAEAQVGIVTRGARDDAAARLAGWRFLQEIQFAQGYR